MKAKIPKAMAVFIFLFLLLSSATFAQGRKVSGKDHIQAERERQQKKVELANRRKFIELKEEYDSMTPAERHEVRLKYDSMYRIAHRYGRISDRYGLSDPQRSSAARAIYAGVATGQFNESYLEQLSLRAEPGLVWRELVRYLIARAPKEPVGHHVHTEPRCSNWWRTTCTDVVISPEIRCFFESWPYYSFTPESQTVWISIIKEETERLRIPLKPPGTRERLSDQPLPSGLPCNEILARKGV